MNRTKHLGILLMGLLPLQASAQDNFRIEVKSAKPLQDICFQLEERFHWHITYEEPPVLSDEETRTEILPSGAPRVFLRASPMSVALAGIVSSTDNYKAAVLTAVLNAYHNSGNRAEFRFTQNGDFIHVLPTKVMGINGEVQDFDPLLDTRVSIPRGSYFLGAFVSSLMSQISQRRGIGIAQATVPTNLFAQTMVT